MYHIDWFVNIEESLHPWDKAHLVMMYDLLNILLDSICWNFVKGFCIYVHQWYWSAVFVFLWHLYLGLVLGWWWPQRMSLAIYLSLHFPGIIWVGYVLSKFLVEFSCEAVWTWAFVCWKISDYNVNFCACFGSVKIFYFFLI